MLNGDLYQKSRQTALTKDRNAERLPIFIIIPVPQIKWVFQNYWIGGSFFYGN